MSGFKFNRQNSDDEDAYPHPNSRKSMKAKISKKQESDDEDEVLPTSCSTKVASGSKCNDFILMLLMIIAVTGSIYYMHNGGYSLEIVQVAPSKSAKVDTDSSNDIIEALKRVTQYVKDVSDLNMVEHHDLKSNLKLTINGGQFEAQHLVLQLMTSEVGDRNKLETAAAVDHTPKMRQGKIMRDAQRS